MPERNPIISSDPMLLEAVDEDQEECDCGNIKKHFMHNCNGTSNYVEMFGCPSCDDECGFCQ